MKDLSVKGTRDLYPEQYARVAHIFETWRKTALSYGFEEFDSPILETLELYTLKSGDEIVGQLYHFPDKGGRMLALRPELTPSLARMVARVHNETPKPIKWFSIPRCMRYERPQKGRLREFFQFNVDIIGENAPTAHFRCHRFARQSWTQQQGFRGQGEQSGFCVTLFFFTRY